MKLENIEIGQLVKYPSNEWINDRKVYTSCLHETNDIGIIVCVYPTPSEGGHPVFAHVQLGENNPIYYDQSSFDLLYVTIDVLWGVNNKIERVQPESIDLLWNIK